MPCRCSVGIGDVRLVGSPGDVVTKMDPRCSHREYNRCTWSCQERKNGVPPLAGAGIVQHLFCLPHVPTGQLSETILRTHRCLISRLHPHIVYEHKGEGAATHTERTTHPRDEEESALIPLCSFAGACEPLPPVLEWWQFHPGRVCKPVPQPAPPRWLAAASQLPPGKTPHPRRPCCTASCSIWWHS